MDLKDIAVISGKPGLYRIMKPTRTGVIVEAVGGGKAKIMAQASHRISILKEISIYTTTGEGSVQLEDVFYAMWEKWGTSLEATKDEEKLREILAEVLPDFDRERVYISDIKKLVAWYTLLGEHLPEVLQRPEEEPEAEENEAENAEVTEENAEGKA
jgi:hypothetical protein